MTSTRCRRTWEEEGGEWGTGGMATKLQAARIASSAGCRCCIVQTSELHVAQCLSC